MQIRKPCCTAPLCSILYYSIRLPTPRLAQHLEIVPKGSYNRNMVILMASIPRWYQHSLMIRQKGFWQEQEEEVKEKQELPLGY